MSRLRTIRSVAWWEFRRCWRLKDVAVTLVLSVVMGVVWFGVLALVASATRDDPARVVVLEPDGAALTPVFDDAIELVPAGDRDVNALVAAVDREELDAVVVIESSGEGWVRLREEAPFVDALRRGLDTAGRATRLAESGLAPEVFERLTAPFDLEVRAAAGLVTPATGDAAASPRRGASKAEKVAAGVFVAFMLIALFTGNSYIFMYITGEKQTRVTEQIVSIISPQTWIDGKIAGLSLVALASMASLVIAMLVWNATLWVLGRGYELSFAVVRPTMLLQFVLLAGLGFLFWFAFFAAIAATIDDPNTSSRSIFILVPVLPLSIALACFHDPDSLLVRICAIVPLSAPSVLPARLVLTEVAWWEPPLAIALLVGAFWLMRRVAGKIFAMGILMHGTEPRWRDMLRALWSA